MKRIGSERELISWRQGFVLGSAITFLSHLYMLDEWKDFPFTCNGVA